MLPIHSLYIAALSAVMIGVPATYFASILIGITTEHGILLNIAMLSLLLIGLRIRHNLYS